MHFSLSAWLQMTVCQQGLYLLMDFRALCPQRAWGVCMWGDDKEQGKYCLCGLAWVQQCATWELLEGLKRMQLKPLVIFPSNVFSWRNCLLISRHPGNLLPVCFFHSILLLLLLPFSFSCPCWALWIGSLFASAGSWQICFCVQDETMAMIRHKGKKKEEKDAERQSDTDRELVLNEWVNRTGGKMLEPSGRTKSWLSQ